MGGLTILVIDDDAADCKLVRRLLTRSFPGVEIHEAQSETHALTLKDLQPHAVLLDYLLPGCTGLELLPELRRKWPRAACIMLTGQGDEEIAKSAIKFGASDYIAKRALNENSLRRMIERGLEMSEMHIKVTEHRHELEVFADVLVHDLKAPIRAVGFLTSELKEDIEAGDFSNVDQCLTLLQRSAKQMRALVDSLAIHVRIDREVEFERSSLTEILGAALLALKQTIAESGARIVTEFEDQLVYCCAPQLGQLIQNVIANGIKYSGDRQPEIRISAEKSGKDGIRIRICDNGIGIPEEYVERVFEPFKRAPSSGDVPGSGLGLATCQKIADRHQGHIWCESRLGEGTSIYLDLPCGLCHSAPGPVIEMTQYRNAG